MIKLNKKMKSVLLQRYEHRCLGYGDTVSMRKFGNSEFMRKPFGKVVNR